MYGSNHCKKKSPSYRILDQGFSDALPAPSIGLQGGVCAGDPSADV